MLHRKFQIHRPGGREGDGTQGREVHGWKLTPPSSLTAKYLKAA